MNFRGEGRLGCLVVLLVVILFIYVARLAVPVYLSKINFEEDLSLVAARAGADDWGVDYIRAQVQNAAQERGFKIAPGDLKVSRSSTVTGRPRIVIEVIYRTEVHFPGYTYEFEFESKATSIIGRL